MTLAVLHILVHLPHAWQLSAGPHGWWDIAKTWPHDSAQEMFGWARGHAISGFESR